ncbi:L-histidine N(alpha)-methyltransferase [Roseateles oligotrophus]|uniref:L-histidine N(Alpha)-methyltransferase n=1 Tax=Roseateles oligotrophus TaxID=1769250 RepID=A0ABT2YC88_9BURK|nr:L-histidine N(alpha)-methyltransferase [Roseateles oligotrophus]MCV2367646.1 L-histidine N(alpha)-methyltransferase [Roseateles oligotrophus]
MKPLTEQGFAADLHRALAQPTRSISPKYFYDELGSALFEQICELPEYYPTRTEFALLRQHGAEMAELIGADAQLIEYGAGALGKVRLLLAHVERPQSFVPIDISGPHLLQACAALQAEHPALKILPVVGDFTHAVALPAAPEPGAGQRVGFFPGSSVGNFTPPQALKFLAMTAEQLRGGGLLIGVDLIKDPALLHAAYNDSQGVTARFNLNLLERARREFGAQFAADGFSHSAFYNAPLRRIEMHLLSMRRQIFSLQGIDYEFDAGETLHTENSYKYSVAGFQALAERAGYRPGPVWTDAQNWFSLHWLQAPPR